MENFVEEKRVMIHLVAAVLIQGKILVGVCFPEGVQCENKCPHVTLFIGGGYKPVDSNAVLESVSENEELSETYKSLSRGMSVESADYVAEIEVKGRNEEVHFIVFEHPISLKGLTKAFN